MSELFSSVQFNWSVISNSVTLWIAACQASLSITNSQSLLKLMSIELVMPSSHLILCRPLLLLPPIPPSIRVISNESTLRMRWPKYWSFSFSVSPSNEPPGLISFRVDWLDLLAVQGTLKSLLQHHSSEASIFWYSELYQGLKCPPWTLVVSKFFFFYWAHMQASAIKIFARNKEDFSKTSFLQTTLSLTHVENHSI